MPIKILEKDTEKRKAKRGQTKGDDDEAIFRKEKAPGAFSGRRKFKKQTHGGGPDAGHIGKLKDALSTARKVMGKRVSPRKPDLSQIKEKMPKYMKPLKKGGRAKHNIGGRANLLEEMGRLDAERMNPNRRAEKHRVIGELNRGYKHGKRVKKQHGGSAQSHYVQHGYGPHKSSGKVLKGKKVGIQIK